MTSMVSAVRSRAVGLVARRFTLSMLPERILWPLHRTGLDPITRMAEFRENRPVTRLSLPFGMRAWLVTGYEPVRQVLGSVDGYSNDFGKFAARVGISGVGQDPGGLGFADPPVHTRLRKVLTPEFTMRRLARLQPRIDAIVAGRLDAMASSDGPVDLWHDFALPIPALTICELLGVPYADRDHFQKLSTARFDLAEGGRAALGAIGDALGYLGGLVEQQRRSPGDGLLGSLIRAHGDEIDDRELAGLADGVLTGGLETSASMLALGALVLMTQPQMADRMRAGDGVDQIVEELLRYLTVVQVAFPRVAVKDVRVGDADIRAGDVVMCSLSGADRDDLLGPDPDRIDPARVPNRSHLAFGYGLHRCIGAELARMELRTAYPALVRRFPGMAPAVAPTELQFRRASIVFGLESLPVTLG
jgi:cytochrome P450